MRKTSGIKNMENFNAARTTDKLKSVTDELARCKKKKWRFTTPDQLVAHLEETTGVHRKTFKRNPYRLAVLEHFGGSGTAVELIPDDNATPYELKVKLEVERIRTANQGRQIRALRKNRSADGLPAALNTQNQQGGLGDKTNYYNDFVNTAILLSLVLERLDGTIVADMDKGCLLDKASRNPIIANAERAGPFLRWFSNQKR